MDFNLTTAASVAESVVTYLPGHNSASGAAVLAAAAAGSDVDIGVGVDLFNISDSKYRSQLTATEDVLVALYLIFCEVMSITLNSFVIGLSIHQRKSLKPSDLFVVYLAISDIGHPVIAYPMVIASSFMHRWVFGDIGCTVNAFTSCFFGINSILTLTVMSFSRYIYVTHFNWARNHGFVMVIFLLAFAFCFTMVWAVSPLVGWGQYSPEPFGTSCTINWNHPDVSYVTSSFVCCLAVPVVVMCYSYGSILYLALKTRHRRLQWGPRSKEGKLWEKNEMRLLKITVCMCLTFMLCWGPYAVLAVVKSYASHVSISPQMSVIPTMTAKASHVIDPFIYCVLNKNFSRLIPKLLGKKRTENDPEQTTMSVPLRHLVKDTSDPTTTPIPRSQVNSSSARFMVISSPDLDSPRSASGPGDASSEDVVLMVDVKGGNSCSPE